MVFARNQVAASFLSKAWRERDQVSKIYIAKVRSWPPFEEHQQLEGTIDAALAPSCHERLKWQVVTPSTTNNAKPSITHWRVLPPNDNNNENIVLELRPITGRTHQLRIHCAHMGSGIIGDSLYGLDQVKQKPLPDDNHNHPRQEHFLHLHASQLSFPHPKTKQVRKFTSNPSWLES